MCGISGIWNFDKEPVKRSNIAHFNNSLTHRGPDGEGIWCNDHSGIALGHRRLAILDLSEAGAQPMKDRSGRFTITYNGEIYNFIELRQSLVKFGYTFHSNSDTEVILAAYHQWGEDMMLRFNGMWAFAIWDNLEKTLFIARDRFGIKPFHYHISNNRFCFASELKAFRSLADYTPTLDKETAQVMLQDPFRVEGSRRTLLASVFRLQGGHCAKVYSNGKMSIRRWWNTLDNLVQPPLKLVDQVEEYRKIFHDSVKLRMRSDVPLGTCLSGGFDSTAVLCTMREISNGKNLPVDSDWQHAFIATFPGAFNDERKEAEEVLRYTNVKGTILPITDKDAINEIDKILDDFDDVYIGLPTAPWLLYREMRRNGVVVSLDGHGADELMGGYKQADYLFLHDAPSLILSPFANFQRISQIRQHQKLNNPISFATQLRKDASSVYLYHPSFVRLRKILRRIIGSNTNFTNNSVLTGDFSLPWEEDQLPKHWDKTNVDFYQMFHATTLPTILRNFDRVSMAHGVEVRMPFMDYRLVCYVMSLPSSSKIGNTQTKYIAREAMRNKMPESIRASKIKVGFNSPMPEWLNGPLNDWRDKLISWATNNHQWADLAKISHTTGKVSWENSSKYWTPLNVLWFARMIENKK